MTILNLTLINLKLLDIKLKVHKKKYRKYMLAVMCSVISFYYLKPESQSAIKFNVDCCDVFWVYCILIYYLITC